MPPDAGYQPFLPAGLQQKLPQPGSVVPGHVDFHSILACIPCFGDDAGNTVYAAVLLKGIILIRDGIRVRHLLKYIQGFWSLKGKLAHLAGYVLKLHITGHMVLHPLVILILVGCVDNDEIAVVLNFIDNQVVHHASCLVAHGAVSSCTVLHDRIIIGQKHIHILQGIRPA